MIARGTAPAHSSPRSHLRAGTIVGPSIRPTRRCPLFRLVTRSLRVFRGEGHPGSCQEHVDHGTSRKAPSLFLRRSRHGVNPWRLRLFSQSSGLAPTPPCRETSHSISSAHRPCTTPALDVVATTAAVSTVASIPAGRPRRHHCGRLEVQADYPPFAGDTLAVGLAGSGIARIVLQEVTVVRYLRAVRRVHERELPRERTVRGRRRVTHERRPGRPSASRVPCGGPCLRLSHGGGGRFFEAQPSRRTNDHRLSARAECA